MNSKHASKVSIHDVKLTIGKVSVLYDAEGKAIAMNVTANVWVAGMPGTTQEFTVTPSDPDLVSYGKSLSDLLLMKIKRDHEEQG